MLTTRTNNRTSVHSLHFLTGWYVGGVLIANPHYVRPSATIKGQTGIARTPVSDKSQSEDERSAAAVDSQSDERDTDSMATGTAPLSSSLSLSDCSNTSAEAHDGDSHNLPSDMFMSDTAANQHITDGGSGTSGENGTGRHREAQDGTDGSEANPAQAEG